MSFSILPQVDPGQTAGGPGPGDLLAAARAYVARGWAVFAVRPTKSTYPNCPGCREAGPEHDPERCVRDDESRGTADHLVCHGFYAAMRDPGRLAAALARYPDALLALRTGRASGVAVVDLEATSADPDLPSGLEVAERWEEWTGGLALPATPLAASTASGGLHLYYRWEERDGPLPSRNRVLPGTDLKADGGYVVLPPAPGRAWRDPAAAPADPGPALADWLRRARGGRGGGAGTGGGGGGGATCRGTGYDFAEFLREGCPGGFRDDYFNDLLFRLRRRGWDRERAAELARREWTRCAQPPDAAWYMPWHHVAYKIERVWRQVRPAEPPAAELLRWVAEVTGRWVAEEAPPDRHAAVPRWVPVQRSGRVTLAPRVRREETP